MCLNENEATNICILDFDYKDKQKQKIFFKEHFLKQMLKSIFENFYVESSFNDGVHVILKTREKFRIINSNYVNKSHNLVVEFKSMCLVAPSEKYKVLNLPKDDTTLITVDEIFVKLNYFFKQLNADEPQIDAATYLVLEKSNLSFFDKRKNKTISKISKKKRIILNHESENLNENLSDDDLPPDVVKHDAKNDKKNKIYSETFNLIDECSKKHLDLPILDNDNTIFEQNMNLFENEKNTHKCKCMKAVFENVMYWSKQKADDRTPAKNIFRNYSANIQFCIVSLEKFINDLEKVGERIYFSSIEFFLQNLELADKNLNSMDMFNNETFDSIFHTLENTKLWYEWTRSYCKLVINIRERNYTSGKYSLSDFDDYSIYRCVTLLNKKGYALSEPAAKQEYNDVYQRVKVRTNYFRNDPATLWFEFILITLKCIEINRLSIDALYDFNQYFTRSHKREIKAEYALRCIFLIKFKNIFYRISSIYDDSYQGRRLKTTIIFVEGLPWMKVTGEVFTKFLHATFPDNSSAEINTIIQMLNNVSEHNDEEVNIQSWYNCLPWLNGILDFKPIVCENKMIITELKSNSISVKDTTEKICENSRRGIYSDAYMEELKLKDAQFRVKKDFRYVLEEEGDENYDSFSVFRNYNQKDSVIDPINVMFNLEDYTKSFQTTDLLSLDNEERYEIFPLFVRSMFGDKPNTGVMGPYHMQNFLASMILICMGILRNKVSQSCLIFQGSGKNGKSAFLELLVSLFGSKCVNIESQNYFKGDEINMQVTNLSESLILVDPEADKVKLKPFNREIADIIPLKRREIFKTPREIISRAFVILATNKGLAYVKDKENEPPYDIAFARRCYVNCLFNILGGGEKTLLRQNNYDLKNELVKHRLKKGLLFYLLDVLHVFDLSSLTNTTCEYLQGSLYSKRLLASYNYDIMSLIRKYYVSYGEIVFDENEIELNTKPIRLDDILRKNPAFNNLTFNMSEIKDTLENLGFKITSRNHIESDRYSLPDLNDSNLVNKPIFYIHGLKSKDSLSGKEKRIIGNPNISNNVILKDLKEFENCNKKFINHHIQIDHRCQFQDDIADQIYDVLSDLVNSKRVKIKKRPKIAKNWRDITQNDIIFDLKKKFSFF